LICFNYMIVTGPYMLSSLKRAKAVALEAPVIACVPLNALAGLTGDPKRLSTVAACAPEYVVSR
jgi:hypothetical protein